MSEHSGVDARTVGVIGLGEIGGGVAESLLRKGRDVVAFDVRDAAYDRFRDRATIASSIAELATACDVVLIAVFDEPQLRDVLGGDGGILSSATPPEMVILLSTVAVEAARWAAGAGAAAGVGFVDCGVSGGRKGAEEGILVGMVGGDPDMVERAGPVIDDFTSLAVHMGPVGTGIQAKLARNQMAIACWPVIWEGVHLALEGGIELDRLLEVWHASDKITGGVLTLVNLGIGLPQKEGDPPPPKLNPEVARKDLNAAIELGEILGIEMPATRLANDRLDVTLGLTD
jgi:3-hydroxyisobutyrate dehydrogenase